MVCQLVGGMVEFAVRQLLPAAHDGRRVGVAAHLLGEHLVHTAAVLGGAAVQPEDRLPPLDAGQSGQLAQRPVPVAPEPVQQLLEGARQPLDRRGVEQVRAVEEVRPQPDVGVPELDGQVEVGGHGGHVDLGDGQAGELP
jgi:hypothetical protein